MSTKNASWAKWPSQWLKRLPNPSLDPLDPAYFGLQIESPPNAALKGSGGDSEGETAVLHFEDFVERPLRSTPQRQFGRGRGRSYGATDGGGGDSDRSGVAG